MYANIIQFLFKEENNMNNLVRWSPRTLFPATFERIFDEFFEDSIQINPRIDIKETEENLVVKAELPGMTKKDISVDLKDSVLTISGEKKTEKSDEKAKFHRTEIIYGSFSKSFHVPMHVKYDQVQAKFKDGILNITIPKDESEKVKQIAID